MMLNELGVSNLTFTPSQSCRLYESEKQQQTHKLKFDSQSKIKNTVHLLTSVTSVKYSQACIYCVFWHTLCRRDEVMQLASQEVANLSVVHVLQGIRIEGSILT